MPSIGPSSLNWWHRLALRYRSRALLIVAVLVTLGLFLSQAIPGVQDLLIQRGVFATLTLLIVIDIARAESSHAERRTMDPAANQDASLPIVIDLLSECRGETIELLEYAGATTLPLVRAVQREGATLRLLMKHPETVMGLQRQRMVTTLDTLYNSIFDGYKGEFEARCYRQPYSLRGRRFGSRLLELGWLTPDYRRQTAYGHANPSILLHGINSSTKPFFDFFDRTFEELWNAPDTEDAQAVLGRIGSGQ
jgi:hypothetical protein